MKRITLAQTCSGEMDCPKEVVMWNYYDHEHLLGTHRKYYNRARILAERHDWALVFRSKKMPFLPIYTSGIGFQYMAKPDVMVTFHKDSWGFLLEQETRFFDLPNNRCRVEVTYRITTHSVFKMFAPIFQKLFQSWFEEVWAEDAPMRLRRWKVYQLGFQDFGGIEYINKKLPKPETISRPPYEFKPPIASLPPIKSPEGETRPFGRRTELGYHDFS